MEPEQRIKQLEDRVASLLKWKEAKMRQQLTFPLDSISRDIIRRDVLVFTGQVTQDAGITPDGGVDVLLNGKIIRLNAVFL